ncbi:hypothetical protein BDP27DRAFT_1415996 [Rhodocollybia butyracea]|uniref:3-oxoacyl-[acyl-carrier-protein] reductase n=1 Tax=Rhodocollybia butyracea TaxID=206335 RepID=A0A9P5UDT8_9AGAR|nr:hypothetical protein BDP27DRAFT_1415996 [Rhodocollybia butyracea]
MVLKSLGVALVTGASQGIGKAIATRLASDGYKVAINDLGSKREQLEELAKEIKNKYGHEVSTVTGDVSKEKDVEGMVEFASKSLGGLDVMVANAGILKNDASILSMGKYLSGKCSKIIFANHFVWIAGDEWDNILRINAKGTFLCYKYAAKQMIAQGRPGGRLIGASSVAGKQGATHACAYTASKFAIRGLTQTAAMEFGQYGITVNAYAPGLIETPMLPGPVSSASSSPESYSSLLQALPSFTKLGHPEDIASLVSYLASKEAGYITGQTISVNGGMFFD